MWLMASVCLLLCYQECTTMVVPCLDWWEIAGRDTTGTSFRLLPVSPLMFCKWVHFSSDLLGLWCRHWKGPTRAVILVVRPLCPDEEQSASSQNCIPTVLSKSAPAIHRVCVRLSSDCMSRSITSLNWILLYAPSRSIATATASYFLWNHSFTSYANAAAFSHVSKRYWDWKCRFYDMTFLDTINNICFTS